MGGAARKKYKTCMTFGKQRHDFSRKHFLVNNAVSYKCIECIIAWVNFLCQEVNGIKYITRF